MTDADREHLDYIRQVHLQHEGTWCHVCFLRARLEAAEKECTDNLYYLVKERDSLTALAQSLAEALESFLIATLDAQLQGLHPQFYAALATAIDSGNAALAAYRGLEEQ